MTVPIPPLPKCLTPGCDNNASTRGICVACYQTARREIRRNTITWEELEKMGLTLPTRRKRRPISGPFAIALANKMREQGAELADLPAADTINAQVDAQVDAQVVAADRALREREAAELAERRAARDNRKAHRKRVAARRAEPVAPTFTEEEEIEALQAQADALPSQQPQEPDITVPGAHAASEAHEPEPLPPAAPVLPWQVK